MIQIKCGTCGTSQGYKTQADGAISLPISEEARLVSRGVAAYVTKPIIGAAPGIAMPAGGEDSRGRCNANDVAGENPPKVETPAEGLEAPDGNGVGHLDEEQLKTMSLDDLKALAKELGVKTTGLRSIAAYAKAIAAVEVEPGEEIAVEDGETPPDLGAEAPVV